MINCPRCQKPNPLGARFCNECGLQFESPQIEKQQQEAQTHDQPQLHQPPMPAQQQQAPARKKGNTIFFVGLAIAILIVIIIYSNTGKRESSNGSTASFDRSNWGILDSNPDAYKGASVEIVGKVFRNPERTNNGTGWQMWADPKKSQWNTIVFTPNPSLQIKDGDFVRISGTVRGAFEGTNAFGAKMSSPFIDAHRATVVDAVAAGSPAKHTANRVLSIKQHDLILIVEKVEFAADETRVFLTLNNMSGRNASFHSFSAKAQQGSGQFDSISFTDYPSIPSSILPGVMTAGIVVFPPMSVDRTKLIFEARTDNYYLNFKPYIFDVVP